MTRGSMRLVSRLRTMYYIFGHFCTESHYTHARFLYHQGAMEMAETFHGAGHQLRDENGTPCSKYRRAFPAA